MHTMQDIWADAARWVLDRSEERQQNLYRSDLMININFGIFARIHCTDSSHLHGAVVKAILSKIAYRLHYPFSTPPQNGLLPSACYPLGLPLEPDWEAGWKQYPQFKGSTRNGFDLSCHASVLIPGHCPHEPHSHAEEEILFMLSGEAELILPEEGAEGGRRRLQSGEFVYYPAFFPHTLRATGSVPANYLMIKWSAETKPPFVPLGFIPMNTQWPDAEHPGRDGYSARGLFEGPTNYLNKLHCHASCVEPGGGYESHSDDHEVAVLLIEGECEILGRRIGPGTVVFCTAGESHGMYNPGIARARYLVFEFHGSYRRPGGFGLSRRNRGGHGA